MENSEISDVPSNLEIQEYTTNTDHPFNRPGIQSFLRQKFPDLANDVIYATRPDYGFDTEPNKRGTSLRNIPEQFKDESEDDYLRRVIIQELWGENNDTLGAALINEYNPKERWNQLTSDTELRDAWKEFIKVQGIEGTYDLFLRTLDAGKRKKLESLFHGKNFTAFPLFQRKNSIPAEETWEFVQIMESFSPYLNLKVTDQILRETLHLQEVLLICGFYLLLTKQKALLIVTLRFNI